MSTSTKESFIFKENSEVFSSEFLENICNRLTSSTLDLSTPLERKRVKSLKLSCYSEELDWINSHDKNSTLIDYN